MKDSKIQWCDHTLNFWWGCLKVSPGCEHCYAERDSKRWGRNIWGPAQTTPRWRTKGPWKEVLKWDKAAEAEGVRKRVFCQSMSDFFEDHPQLDEWRKEAFEILESLQWLDVQLLTKRPENVLRMVPERWRSDWPDHVWLGTSVENQEYADKRIPELLKIDAPVLFLSCEPLLGSVDLAQWLWPEFVGFGTRHPDWVIIGGESGPKARLFHLWWAWDLIRQCRGANIPVFIKQIGSNPWFGDFGDYSRKINDPKGGNPGEWPERLRVREFPKTRETTNGDDTDLL